MVGPTACSQQAFSFRVSGLSIYGYVSENVRIVCTFTSVSLTWICKCCCMADQKKHTARKVEYVADVLHRPLSHTNQRHRHECEAGAAYSSSTAEPYYRTSRCS